MDAIDTTTFQQSTLPMQKERFDYSECFILCRRKGLVRWSMLFDGLWEFERRPRSIEGSEVLPGDELLG